MFDPTSTFRSEASRLETFTNWPVPEIVTPEQLAKAGFYYQGTGDKVRFIIVRDKYQLDDLIKVIFSLILSSTGEMCFLFWRCGFLGSW